MLLPSTSDLKLLGVPQDSRFRDMVAMLKAWEVRAYS